MLLWLRQWNYLNDAEKRRHHGMAVTAMEQRMHWNTNQKFNYKGNVTNWWELLCVLVLFDCWCFFCPQHAWHRLQGSGLTSQFLIPRESKFCSNFISALRVPTLLYGLMMRACLQMNPLKLPPGNQFIHSASKGQYILFMWLWFSLKLHPPIYIFTDDNICFETWVHSYRNLSSFSK